jgi:hypothetical protein
MTTTAGVCVEPKSRSGRRHIPIGVRRCVLIERKVTASGEPVVGRAGGTRPFNDKTGSETGRAGEDLAVCRLCVTHVARCQSDQVVEGEPTTMIPAERAF